MIKQGEPGKEAFIILSGKATVKRGGKKSCNAQHRLGRW